MKKIRPRHNSLREIPLSIYKKLPKKSLCSDTLNFLLDKHPKYLVKILDSKHTSFDDKYLILELMSYANETDVIVDTLLRYSKSEMPALREAALFSVSFFSNETICERLEEAEIIEENSVIRESVRAYLEEFYA